MRTLLRSITLNIALSLILVVLAISPVYAQGDDPMSKVPSNVAASVVRITGLDTDGNQPYTCTGIVIAKHKVLTAAHCIGSLVRVDGRATTTLGTDPADDLALLASDTPKPALRIAAVPPITGTLIFGFGYGLGQYGQMITAHRVVAVAPISPDTPPGVIVLGVMYGGMSGGPMVTETGKVVAVIQRTNSHIGVSYGVASPTILKFLQALR